MNVRPPVDGKLAQPLHMLSMESIKKEFDVAALGHFTVLRAFLSEVVHSCTTCSSIISLRRVILIADDTVESGDARHRLVKCGHHR